MKLSLYNEKDGAVRPEPVMKLYLQQHTYNSNRIRLMGIDGNGEKWVILEILEDGTMERQPSIVLDSGWPLTPAGELKFVDE